MSTLLTADQMKQQAAQAALSYIEPDMIVGVGTGSTVKHFIDALATIKHKVDITVSSSEQSTAQLKALGFQVRLPHEVPSIDIYVDGADEINPYKQMIKGGGAALTREKILAAQAKQFLCIADESKQVKVLGKFPLPVEVIPMARSYVAHELIKLGGQPIYREGCITDNDNIILDLHNLSIIDPPALETAMNQITGVVTNGIFAHRPADIALIALANGEHQTL